MKATYLFGFSVQFEEDSHIIDFYSILCGLLLRFVSFMWTDLIYSISFYISERTVGPHLHMEREMKKGKLFFKSIYVDIYTKCFNFLLKALPM
jgi:hypothetical protein